MTKPWKALRSAATWHVRSQQAARHNALVAGTALAERRREQVEVEEFLARHLRTRRAEPRDTTSRPA